MGANLFERWFVGRIEIDNTFYYVHVVHTSTDGGTMQSARKREDR